MSVRCPTCTSTCRSAPTAAATATSSPSPATQDVRGRYVDALIAELARVPAGPIDTVFIGGGTPSLLDDDLLARLLAGFRAAPSSPSSAIPNGHPRQGPSTRRGRRHPSLAGRAELPPAPARDPRAAGEPGHGRRRGRDAPRGRRDNLNLDLIFGVPGQSQPTSRPTSTPCSRLRPTTSAGTSSRRSPGRASRTITAPSWSARPSLDGALLREVVARLRGAGYRWYETANFCLPGRECAAQPGLLAGARLSGVGVGAVSTRGLSGAATCRRCPATWTRSRAAAGRRPSRALTAVERMTERLMLGLRLDRPLD